MQKISLIIIAFSFTIITSLTAQTDSAALEKLRTESGVDPTRIQSRLGYTFLIFDQAEDAGQINNRVGITLGVNRWSFSAKYEVVSITTGIPGTGFKSGFGDIRFSMLNAFFVKGKHAFAAAAEFLVPTGKPGFGIQYFAVTPSLTYSHTFNPSLIFAVQPQYTFALMKDPLYPNLSVLTIRSFLAKFTKAGYFFVFEPRPIFDFGNNIFNFIISPIVGKSLGGGFNLIALMEIPTRQSTNVNQGILYQFGFNRNF